MRGFLAILFSVLGLLVAVLIPELATAAATDPLTIGDADRIAEETNMIITVSTGAVSFFLGWVAGAST